MGNYRYLSCPNKIHLYIYIPISAINASAKDKDRNTYFIFPGNGNFLHSPAAWFGYAHQPTLTNHLSSTEGESPRAQKIEFCMPNLELKKMNMFTQNDEFSYWH